MYIVVAVYAVGAVIVTAAQNIGMFIFGRFAHGIGAHAFLTACK
jgi:hypothetical protein